MTEKTLVVKEEGMTLDALLWREFRAEVQGRVEAVLTANPGTAEHGLELPVGTKVTVEIVDLQAAPPVVRVIRLWG